MHRCLHLFSSMRRCAWRTPTLRCAYSTTSILDNDVVQPFRVGIVGRPNVGKSTLFNRLVGRGKRAITHNRAGVTRDVHEEETEQMGMKFRVLDTPGLEDVMSTELETRMKQLTFKQLEELDLILFVVDARVGVTPLDTEFGRSLRKLNVPIVAVLNKADTDEVIESIDEATLRPLGFGTPIFVSAIHATGITELLRCLLPFHLLALKQQQQQQQQQHQHQHEEQHEEAQGKAVAMSGLTRVQTSIPIRHDKQEEEAEEENGTSVNQTAVNETIQIAVLGVPNVGKSSLVNLICGRERVLVGDQPGITRSAVPVAVKYANNRNLTVVDTAGIRPKSKVTDTLEKLMVGSSFSALQYAHVAILLLDACQPFTVQEADLARRIHEEGRGCVIALNKWDKVRSSDRSVLLKDIRTFIHDNYGELRTATILPVSCLTETGVSQALDATVQLYERWCKRLPTSRLNQWLQKHMLIKRPNVKIRYMTQVKARPPTFVLQVGRQAVLDESYKRNLAITIQQQFGLEGVPIRFLIRHSLDRKADRS